MLALAVVLALVASAAADDEEKGCRIVANACSNYPEFRRTLFRDKVGEESLGAADNDAACLKRAEDFHYWCGNDASTASVAASYAPSKWSQVYVPGACEQGWSQWDAFCYKHYWENKNWYEAEALCRERGGHLCSIHSRAENRFIYQLTSGLTAWIGYQKFEEQEEEKHKWSDDTKDDFANMAKNCTGREHEPDCKPEEKKSQWYDWNGADAGTFVCKRDAKLPIALLKNVTAKDLVENTWDTLLPALAAAGALPASQVATTKPRLGSLPAGQTAATKPRRSTLRPKSKPQSPVLSCPKGRACTRNG